MSLIAKVMSVDGSTLIKIAVFGGFATAGFGYYVRWHIHEQISKTEYYIEALRTLRSHGGAVHLLGAPIREGKIDVSDTEKNFTAPLLAKYEVPVKGSKNKGILYFSAERETEYDRWKVSKMELGLKNEPDRRLVVKSKDSLYEGHKKI